MDLNFTMNSRSPLEMILRDVERAIEARLYYLAVHLALSLPDICGSLECDLDPDKPWKGVEDRYRDWFAENLASRFHVFTVDDCWAMRGGVIHNGTLKRNRKSAKYDRIVLMLPGENAFHECVSGGNGGSTETALQLDTVRFCRRVTSAAREWYEKKKDDPIVAANIENLVRFRPEGIAPHFTGMRVIA